MTMHRATCTATSPPVCCAARGVSSRSTVRRRSSRLPTSYLVTKRGDPGASADTAVDRAVRHPRIPGLPEVPLGLRLQRQQRLSDRQSTVARPQPRHATGHQWPRAVYTNQAKEFQAPIDPPRRRQRIELRCRLDAVTSENNHRSWHPVIDSTGRTGPHPRRRVGRSAFNCAAAVAQRRRHTDDVLQRLPRLQRRFGEGSVVPDGGDRRQSLGTRTDRPTTSCSRGSGTARWGPPARGVSGFEPERPVFQVPRLRTSMRTGNRQRHGPASGSPSDRASDKDGHAIPSPTRSTATG